MTLEPPATDTAAGQEAHADPSEGMEVHDHAPGVSWRSMSAIVLGTALVLVAAAVITNLYVDPQDISGARRWRALTSNGYERTARLKAFDALPSAPATLLIGSSTVREIDPRDLRRQGLGSAFNAGVAGGSPVEAWVFLRRSSERFGGRRPRVVWGIDVMSLQPHDIDPALLRDADARDALARRDVVRGGGQAAQRLASWSVLRQSVQQVRDGIRLDSEEPLTVRGDGFRRRDPLASTGGASLMEETTAQVEQTLLAGAYERLDPLQVRYLRKSACAAPVGDAPATIVVMPVSPSARRSLGPAGWNDRRADLIDELSNLASRCDIRLVDATDAEAIGLTDRDFHDHQHLTPEGAEALTTWLVAQDAFRRRASSSATTSRSTS